MNPLHSIRSRRSLLRRSILALTLLNLGTFAWHKSCAQDKAATTSSTKIIHGQGSFELQTKEVQLYVTETGGHMAPVTFFRNSDRPIQPYHVSPWQDEPVSAMPAPVLVSLRGDFFCMPFGGNSEAVQGESHPPHGEIAGSAWKYESLEKSGATTTLSLGIDTKVRKGHVAKKLSVVDGENNIYCEHRIDGFAGKVPLGHHATLRMPDKPGAVRVTTSKFDLGITYPQTFSDPAKREYQALLPGAVFKELSKVPSLFKNDGDRDLTRQPGPQGYADLIQILNSQPTGNEPKIGWVAATYSEDGYVWFALKDPTVLRSTVFWMENHGRHGHPWNGRNNCLGLEDVTAYFADGLSASMNENDLTKKGFVTALGLSADKPTSIRYIQGVAKIPKGFESVSGIEYSPGKIRLISPSKEQVEVSVRHEFLASGKL